MPCGHLSLLEVESMTGCGNRLIHHQWNFEAVDKLEVFEGLASCEVLQCLYDVEAGLVSVKVFSLEQVIMRLVATD